MAADPKWLEILKASGWQTFAIAGGIGLYFLLFHFSLIPAPPLVFQATLGVGGLIAGCLTLTTMLRAAWKAAWPAFVRAYTRRGFLRSVEAYLQYMTEKERAIIAHLIHHKQQSFTAAQDGGYAVTLIGRGIIVRAARPGQIFSSEDTPFSIPPDVWRLLEANVELFPYEAPRNGGHPWRVPWMAR